MPTSPQDLGAAMVIAKVVDGAIVPIFIALFLGIVAWGLTMSWMQRSTNQRLTTVLDKIGELKVQGEENRDKLEEHRRDDAKEFAAMKESVRSVRTEMALVERMGRFERALSSGHPPARLAGD